MTEGDLPIYHALRSFCRSRFARLPACRDGQLLVLALARSKVDHKPTFVCLQKINQKNLIVRGAKTYCVLES